MREHLLVIRMRREEPADREIDPARLVSRELAVAKIRLVDNLRESREAAIPKAGPLEECLEGAVVPDVAELGPGRVERDGLLGELPRVREHERGVGVDEPLDEPSRGNAVHVGTAPRDPLPPSEVAEIARGLLSSFRLLGWSCTHVDGLPQPFDFGALWRLEKIEPVELLVVPLELGELRLDPRIARRRLAIEGLEELSVAPSKMAVLRIAGLVEQSNDFARAHVFDLLDAEERRLAPRPLNLLGQPLEVLVVVRSVGKEVDRPLEGDGTDRAQPAPHPHAQARRIRGQAHYEQNELGIHCVATVKLLFHTVKGPIMRRVVLARLRLCGMKRGLPRRAVLTSVYRAKPTPTHRQGLVCVHQLMMVVAVVMVVDMGVIVLEGSGRMRVHVRLGSFPTLMFVLVVQVMDVAVGVHPRLVPMPVRVPLA